MSFDEFLNKVQISIQDSYPGLIEQPVLSTILPSILLSLIARETNMIVNTTHPYDIQKSICKLLSTAFGVSVKRIRIANQQTAGQFLQSFFLSSSPVSSSSSSRKRRSRRSLTRSISAPRPPSSNFTECSDSTTIAKMPRYKTDPVQYDSDPTLLKDLPQAVVICHLEKVGRGAQLALAEVLRSRRIHLPAGTFELPKGFFIIYISPINEGYERPNVHMSLLDHFAFSINVNRPTTPIPNSSSSPRLRPNSITSPNYKPPIFPQNELPTTDKVHVSPLAANYSTTLISAIRHHPELDGTFITARCIKHAEKLIRASGIVFREKNTTVITEAHVRRVIPPILIHRLRVRNSPREQILGLLSEKAGVRHWAGASEDNIDEKRTIKTILASVLSEV